MTNHWVTHVTLSTSVQDTPHLTINLTDGPLSATRTGLVFSVTDFQTALDAMTQNDCVVEDSVDRISKSFDVIDPAGNVIAFRAMNLT